MSGLTLDASVKDWFFDREQVIAKIGRDNAKRLSKAGAFICRRARTDILRKRKATSTAGSPPSVHSSDSFANLRNIRFALDKRDESLIVGPVKINSGKTLERTGKMTIPELHEKGGTAPVALFRSMPTLANPDPAWMPASVFRSRERGFETKTIQARYAARPFMGPALQKEITAGTLAGLFARGG